MALKDDAAVWRARQNVLDTQTASHGNSGVALNNARQDVADAELTIRTQMGPNDTRVFEFGNEAVVCETVGGTLTITLQNIE